MTSHFLILLYEVSGHPVKRYESSIHHLCFSELHGLPRGDKQGYETASDCKRGRCCSSRTRCERAAAPHKLSNPANARSAVAEKPSRRPALAPSRGASRLEAHARPTSLVPTAGGGTRSQARSAPTIARRSRFNDASGSREASDVGSRLNRGPRRRLPRVRHEMGPERPKLSIDDERLSGPVLAVKGLGELG